jgi:hypothetical protein
LHKPWTTYGVRSNLLVRQITVTRPANLMYQANDCLN